MARAPVGYNQCITAVEQAAGRELAEGELDALFTRLQGRVRRYQTQGLGETDAYVRAGKELGDEMRLEAVVKKRNALLNEQVKRERMAQLREGNEAADIRALTTGREGSRERGGIADSTHAKVQGLTAQVLGPFVQKLRAAGLHKIMAKGNRVFDRDVVRELWSIEDGGKPATANTLARTAAEIINEAQENVRLLQNKAGAWIGKLEHYVTRQSHDMDKIRGKETVDGKWSADANYRAWRDYILPRLDERTFDTLDEVTPESVDKFLRSAWRALSTGVHETATGANQWGQVGRGTGPANLARRVSQDRKLLFKDADAWAGYHEQYGKGSLMDAVRSGLENGARNTALMRDWGPNPKAMFETITDMAMKRAKDREDFAQVDRLQNTFTGKIFDVVTGEAAVPQNAGWAQLTAAATALQTLTKLGGVVLSSMPDLAVTSSVLRHNGVPLLESYSNQLRALLPKGAERETGDLLGVGVDGVLGNVASRHSAVDGMRGTSAKLVDLFHKWNLLEWWTESMKFGVGMMLSRNMGRLATQSFDALPMPLQRTLGRYGIDAADWDAARASVGKHNGKDMVLPAMIPDGAVRSKFQTYLADQVQEAVNEPDAYARALSTWGTQAGTASGAAVRMLMQFKSYPITFMRRTLNRELNRNDGVDVAGITHLVVATTLLGYAAMEMKGLARGQNTRTSNADSYKDWSKILMASMVQGGGLGLYGDFLFGDSSRMGAGPVLSLFGPTAGTADAFFKTLQQGVHALGGDERAGQDAAAGALRFVKNNIPFINMFYSRAALDYLLWHRLQEALNPGYLARYEERMRRESDVTFWMRPTESPYR